MIRRRVAYAGFPGNPYREAQGNERRRRTGKHRALANSLRPATVIGTGSPNRKNHGISENKGSLRSPDCTGKHTSLQSLCRTGKHRSVARNLYREAQGSKDDAGREAQAIWQDDLRVNSGPSQAKRTGKHRPNRMSTHKSPISILSEPLYQGRTVRGSACTGKHNETQPVPDNTVTESSLCAIFFQDDCDTADAWYTGQEHGQTRTCLILFHVPPGTHPRASPYVSTCLPVRSPVLPGTPILRNKRT